MKTLEYIKSVLDEKTKGLEQVEANPGMYDAATVAYAKTLKEDAEKWYKQALEREENKDI